MGRFRGAQAMAVAFTLTSCGGGAVSTSPSEQGSPSPASPAVTFAFDGEEPAVSRELAGSDEAFINPGAVIEHDGRLHMFANLFSGWPGEMDIMHLTSDDGIAWALASPEPILTSETVDLAKPGFDVSTGYVADDGTWVLIFETVTISDPWVLGRATAPAPEGPWTADPEPFLTPEAGTIDAGGIQWPSVVRTGDGYLLYYTALDREGGGTVIALATSPDGETWEKRAEPVLVADLEWESGRLDRPRAAVTPNGLAMVYAGGRLTDRGLAISADGITWQKLGSVPVISDDTFPVSGRAWDAALIYRDDVLAYYLEIGSASASSGTQVYRATAPLPEMP
ncbi:MAG TPA: hypothetical protein VFH90_03020 [Candidatus Limnocylindria bacterium]|nr:hypothetical protein [Candidatus Limnocylindria bacterium]